ncbi:MAG: phosphate acyltransferase PlsX [Verrucomicrobia bacterium]|nr:phosphate acyltransferase PlsX [Verrucomicrobiota bacterium]
MRIAVDAMGGDYAPGEIVRGAIQAASDVSGLSGLYLVGREDAIRAELDAVSGRISPKIEIVHASEVVEMSEAPAIALRRKKDSSIRRVVELVKEGRAEAIFTAGNTGAAVAATTLWLRTLAGVDRPAIATVMPTPSKPFILIDAGANPECDARLLAQFAVMGSVYSRVILGTESPKIGLLSIGEEDAKGSGMTKETFSILERSHLNFAGNVEGSHLFDGEVDVVVCDGFVGNVVLKTSEAVAHAVSSWLKRAFLCNPVSVVGALLLKRSMSRVKKAWDPATYGGAPLLGVNGICIIGHGSSNALAVRNGIRVACESVAHQVTDMIEDGIAQLDFKSETN